MRTRTTIWGKYDTNYIVSIDGEAISLNRYGKSLTFKYKKLKGVLTARGYVAYNLGEGQILAHQALGKVFLPKVRGKHFICHKDDIKNNNVIENLYRGDAYDNMRDASRNGVCYAMPKEWIEAARQSNLTECFIKKDGIELRFDSMMEAAKYIGVSKSALSQAIKKGGKSRGYQIRKGRR